LIRIGQICSEDGGEYSEWIPAPMGKMGRSIGNPTGEFCHYPGPDDIGLQDGFIVFVQNEIGMRSTYEALKAAGVGELVNIAEMEFMKVDGKVIV